MHILMMIGVGLVLFACFFLLRRLFAETEANTGLPRYTKWFVRVWAVGAAANSAVGVMVAGFPVVTEIIVFVPVFGVPALVAILIAAWSRSRARQ